MQATISLGYVHLGPKESSYFARLCLAASAITAAAFAMRWARRLLDARSRPVAHQAAQSALRHSFQAG